MVRILNILAIAALIGSAIYAYTIKYETIFHAETIVKLQHEIKLEQDQIGTLRAEWAHLTRPERIQGDADEYAWRCQCARRCRVVHAGKITARIWTKITKR